MREIEFRGKSKENGDWFYGHLSIYKKYSKKEKQDIPVCYINGGGYLKEGRALTETVGQYTGVRDCTRTEEYPEGKKIFEGDIVKDEKERLFVIEYKFGGFNLTPLAYSNDEFSWNPLGDMQTAGFLHESCEVIGNIYENPELLEGE